MKLSIADVFYNSHAYYESLEQYKNDIDPKTYEIMSKTYEETIKFLSEAGVINHLRANLHYFIKAGFDSQKAREFKKEHQRLEEIDYINYMESLNSHQEKEGLTLG